MKKTWVVCVKWCIILPSYEDYHKQIYGTLALINHSKDTHPVWCNVTCGFFSRGFELVLAENYRKPLSSAKICNRCARNRMMDWIVTIAVELISLWLCWCEECPCGSTDNHPSLNLPSCYCRSYSFFAEQTGRLMQSARSFWVFSREWCVPPGYAWLEDFIDSRNLSRDTRFCRYTWSLMYSNLQVVLLIFSAFVYPCTSDGFSWNGSSCCERSLLHAPCLCPTQLKPQHDQHHGSLDPLLNQLGAQKKSGALGDFREFPPSGPFLL